MTLKPEEDATNYGAMDDGDAENGLKKYVLIVLKRCWWKVHSL